ATDEEVPERDLLSEARARLERRQRDDGGRERGERARAGHERASRAGRGHEREHVNGERVPHADVDVRGRAEGEIEKGESGWGAGARRDDAREAAAALRSRADEREGERRAESEERGEERRRHLHGERDREIQG